MTLVWGQMPGPEIAHVVFEGTGFYGRDRFVENLKPTDHLHLSTDFA